MPGERRGLSRCTAVRPVGPGAVAGCGGRLTSGVQNPHGVELRKLGQHSLVPRLRANLARRHPATVTASESVSDLHDRRRCVCVCACPPNSKIFFDCISVAGRPDIFPFRAPSRSLRFRSRYGSPAGPRSAQGALTVQPSFDGPGPGIQLCLTHCRAGSQVQVRLSD